MARARNIKPSIMDNEELAELAPLTRLLFVYLWMLADREGRLEDRPKRIAAQALPYDRTADVGVMLDDLQSAGFIVRYVVDGMACIEVTAFTKHQNPHIRESNSVLPSPEQASAKEVPRHNLGSDKASPRSPDPGFLIPDPGLGTVQDKPANTDRKKKALKTQMPDDFAVSERVSQWAKENKFDRLGEHLDAFKRKSVARAYSFASWDDAFMEAILEDWAKIRTQPRGYQNADVARQTVPAKPGPDPMQAVFAERDRKAAPIPQAIREQMAKLTNMVKQ